MSKHRELQALPDGNVLLQQVIDGTASSENLDQFCSLIHAVRVGRMTARRIQHVRDNYDADEVRLHEQAIELAGKYPAVLNCYVDLLTSDGILEHLLVEHATGRLGNEAIAKATVRGFQNLRPVDSEIGWSTPEQVQEVREFLSAIKVEELIAEFDSERVLGAEVYRSTTWLESPQSERESQLESLFRATQAFFQQASELQFGVLSRRWG